MEERKYLTPADVAKAAGVTAATVVIAADRGDLVVAAKTVGGARLFREADADRWVRDRKQQKAAG
jgi:DNA-binding transcriptional MerR regulator